VTFQRIEVPKGILPLVFAPGGEGAVPRTAMSMAAPVPFTANAVVALLAAIET
jgi:hypothetical protein